MIQSVLGISPGAGRLWQVVTIIWTRGHGGDREKEEERTELSNIIKEELSGFTEFGFRCTALEVFGDTQAAVYWVKEDVGSEELRKASGLGLADLGILVCGWRTTCGENPSRRAL